MAVAKDGMAVAEAGIAVAKAKNLDNKLTDLRKDHTSLGQIFVQDSNLVLVCCVLDKGCQNS